MRIVAFKQYGEAIAKVHRLMAGHSDTDASSRACFFALIEEAASAPSREKPPEDMSPERWSLRRATFIENPVGSVQTRFHLEYPSLASKATSDLVRRAIDAACGAGERGNKKGDIYSDVWFEISGARVAGNSIIVGLSKPLVDWRRRD
jgi:hypothetical protein